MFGVDRNWNNLTQFSISYHRLSFLGFCIFIYSLIYLFIYLFIYVYLLFYFLLATIGIFAYQTDLTYMHKDC